jgi:ketosteroid isomerase-like protein
VIGVVIVEITLDQLSEWLRRYFYAWVSNDPNDVSPLFAEDAIYFYGPFNEPTRGREGIIKRWIANPDKQFDITPRYEAIAVNGDLGVAYCNVKFRTQSNNTQFNELDGILLVRFNSAMGCIEHREWYSHRAVE